MLMQIFQKQSVRSPGAVAILAAALAVALCSCMSTPPGTHLNQVDVPEAFSVNGETKLPNRWWESLDNDSLNRLIEQALYHNFSLKTAWNRVAQARALAKRAGSGRGPVLDGIAGVSRTVSGAPGIDRTYKTDLSLALQASYEIDVWGRIEASVDAAGYDLQATREELDAAAITLSASVAIAWLQLTEQTRQLELLDAQIDTNRQYLEIITERFRSGRAAATDVLQQRQLVEQRRGEKYLVESAIQTLRHQLAVLTGNAPGSPMEYDIPSTLPGLPGMPGVGVPAELIQRRPDIRSAALAVRAADRRVAAAIADRFPRLTLTASASTSAEEVRNLFDNWLASLAANAAAPLIDSGRRRAEVERTRAVLSQAINGYGQIVLDALKEVEDAIVREEQQKRYIESLKTQLDLSGKSTEQTRGNYIKGAADFTRYLTTLLEHQRLQRAVLQAERNLLVERVNLYRALAGGWELPVPDDESEISP